MADSDASSNILVAVRIRPLSTGEVDCGHRSCCQVLGGKIVAIKKNGDQGGYLKSQQPMVNEYAFDEVFDDRNSQKDVYEGTAKRFVPYVLDGQNVTVFAYGATGAGKTHTMLGNTRADSAAQNADAGIIPNAVRDVFVNLHKKAKQCTHGESYKVFVSFLEVYNEQVYDLLEPSGRVLSVREDKEKGIVAAAGLTEQPVTSSEQVIDYILQGNKQRKTEATMANVVSSRSHAILQLTVRHTVRTEAGREGLLESKLALIDLAGSERASATNNRGARLQEGANINKSLLALANCINALAENANSKKVGNVKFRDSKLTHLLRSSLEGNGHLIMIANINPSDQTYEDSHNTLKYANRAKNIKINPAARGVQLKETNWAEREVKLREENAHLRQTIRQLEDKVIELEYFKSSVLANNGILPPDFELMESVSVDELPPFVMDDSRVSDVFELSVSTAAAEDADNDFEPSAALRHAFPDDMDLEDAVTVTIPMGATVKPKGRESLLPTARRTVVGSENPKVATVARPAAEVEVEDSTEDQGLNKKRRASFLPTRARSSKRLGVADEMGVKAVEVAAEPAAPRQLATPAPTTVIAPENPMAWAAEPNPVYKVSAVPVKLVNTTPVTVGLAPKPSDDLPDRGHPAEEPKTAWLDDGTQFDLGHHHTKPLAATRIARPSTSTGAARTSMAGGVSRRRSIAQVSAMLDFLQQDVSTSLTAVTAGTPQPLVAAASVTPAISAVATPASEGSARMTRSKALHAHDPNVPDAHAQEPASKSAAKDRRKSVSTMKASFSVDAVTLGNNENTPAPLRRSSRRASLTAQAWTDV